MSNSNFGRRNFGRLALVATGAMVVGAKDAVAQDNAAAKVDLGVDPALLIASPNACKGLNTCKGEGKGQHDCAGMGSCAAVAKHDCAGANECKGAGGCGGYPGQNTCKGKGECGVPLNAGASKLARKQFEQLMKAAGKKVGPAPK
ncbi:hypothetical protein FF011L_31560 [Roseimaritima multifibrata]|uniref:Uncharacterized protein n=1 Tax=Roseimaritima multifibrata TaxID=1930274 RepID=A0A517MHV3_9BACT|nr:hypothetical protein [Roseimaritima multifibrata]QDS94377.1 hypothetical protein FF011L_31560 [Roseimaritima multifibrata]